MNEKFDKKVLFISLFKMYCVNIISSAISFVFIFFGIIENETIFDVACALTFVAFGIIFNFKTKKEDLLAISIFVIYISIKFLTLYLNRLDDTMIGVFLYSNYSNWVISYSSVMVKNIKEGLLFKILIFLTVFLFQYSVLLRPICKKIFNIIHKKRIK